MRSLNECKAEIFRVSSERIAERQKKLRRAATLSVPVCIFLVLFSVTALPRMVSVSPAKSLTGSSEGIEAESTASVNTGGSTDSVLATVPVEKGTCNSGTTGRYNDSLCGTDIKEPLLHYGSLSSFSFSLTWGVYGTSSYDSVSGKLVKFDRAENSEDYVTEHRLTVEDEKKIYELIRSLDITSYPDSYDPQEGTSGSDPSMTLILSVKTDTIQKTVTAENITLTYESGSEAGQRFLDVCRGIVGILTATDAWKSLPEVELYYY